MGKILWCRGNVPPENLYGVDPLTYGLLFLGTTGLTVIGVLGEALRTAHQVLGQLCPTHEGRYWGGELASIWTTGWHIVCFCLPFS